MRTEKECQKRTFGMKWTHSCSNVQQKKNPKKNKKTARTFQQVTSCKKLKIFENIYQNSSQCLIGLLFQVMILRLAPSLGFYIPWRRIPNISENVKKKSIKSSVRQNLDNLSGKYSILNRYKWLQT